MLVELSLNSYQWLGLFPRVHPPPKSKPVGSGDQLQMLVIDLDVARFRLLPRFPTSRRASAPRPIRCDGRSSGNGGLGQRTASETGTLDGGYLGGPGRLYHGTYVVYAR